ncbi:hypothetical protein E2C01_094092 [Portunus trituberculatus]|uniref:Uncharacterized protein n=1 Tax=Portunus trituberculatus TaxID=210409 RepID=A0A5B7JKT6_PORTR|nr:hypothetical protein [Portunus trituberculatus]
MKTRYDTEGVNLLTSMSIKGSNRTQISR